MQKAKKELAALWGNTEKRRGFLKNYREWGVWFTTQELGLVYYKFELPDGRKIVAMEYRHVAAFPESMKGNVEARRKFFLWENVHFNPDPVSEHYIVERLKDLKTAMQKELRQTPTV